MTAFNWIKGFKVGIEYTDLNEEDNEFMGIEGYDFLYSIDLGFFRIMRWS